MMLNGKVALVTIIAPFVAAPWTHGESPLPRPDLRNVMAKHVGLLYFSLRCRER
jgi:hypothetical protein